MLMQFSRLKSRFLSSFGTSSPSIVGVNNCRKRFDNFYVILGPDIESTSHSNAQEIRAERRLRDGFVWALAKLYVEYRVIKPKQINEIHTFTADVKAELPQVRAAVAWSKRV